MFYNFIFVPFLFQSVEQNGTKSTLEQKWNRNGTEMEQLKY